MRPLPLTAEMALAAILGRKTETRRPVKLGKGKAAVKFDHRCKAIGVSEALGEFGHTGPHLTAPFGLPGQRLWLREPGRVVDVIGGTEDGVAVNIKYIADGVVRKVTVPHRLYCDGYPTAERPKWVQAPQGIPNGIFREAARYFTTVQAVRVERLWEISEADALAEGVSLAWYSREHDIDGFYESYRDAFEDAWNRIYAAKGQGWDANPWVWVVEFKRVGASA